MGTGSILLEPRRLTNSPSYLKCESKPLKQTRFHPLLSGGTLHVDQSVKTPTLCLLRNLFYLKKHVPSPDKVFVSYFPKGLIILTT